MLYMMVGLAGSGKTTIAAKLSYENNAAIYSSDCYRRMLLGNENDQSKNELVFSTLYKDIKKALLKGENVIFDATNLTIKDRKKALTQMIPKNRDIQIIAYIVNTPIAEVIERNAARERKVPEKVIYRQVKKFQVPFKGEGFTSIICHKMPKNNVERAVLIESMMLDFHQDNPNHDFTLHDHSVKTYDFLMEVVKEEEEVALTTAALLHDIGKLYTKTVDEEGCAHYYGHANIGAYDVLCEDLVPFSSQEDFLDCIFYINYHMFPFDWKEKKTEAKYNSLFGSKKVFGLKILHIADINSSKNRDVK